MRTFFLAPTRYGVGLTSVSLGLVRALDSLGLRVNFFKPIAQLHVGDTGPERSTQLVKRTTDAEPVTPITSHRAEDLLGDNKGDVLMEEIVALFDEASKGAEVMVVEGLVPTREMPYANRLNSDMVKTLNAEVILVTEPGNDKLPELASKLEISANSFGGLKNPKIIGYVLNKLGERQMSKLRSGEEFKSLPEFARKSFEPLGYIPMEKSLSSPRTMDIAEYLGADVLNQGEQESRRVTSYTLSARTPANMIHHLKPGNLVITPGDRDDIILATCMAALNGVPLAGLLLTSGIRPANSVMELCKKAIDGGLPVMMVESDSYNTATMLDRMPNELPIDDTTRVEQVMDTVAHHLNKDWFKSKCDSLAEPRLSPPAFRYKLVQDAIAANKRVVLPEGDEPRTIQAAAICQERGIAQCILLGKRSVIEQVAKDHGIVLPEGLVIMEPDCIRGRYIDPMVELRKSKGLTAPMAESQLEDTVVLGTMMLATNEVDGLVSGAVHTTANTIRPAFQLIKPSKDSGGLVSSIFFMLLPDQVILG